MFKIISSILHIWIIRLYFNCFFTPRMQTHKIRIMFWVSYYLINYIILSRFNQAVLNFATGYALMLALCCALYEGSNRKKGFFTLSIYMSGMLTEIIAAMILQEFGHSIGDAAFAGSILSKLLLLTIIHGFMILRYRQEHGEPTAFYLFLLLGTTIAGVIIIHTLFLYSRIAQSTAEKTLATASILLIFVLNLSLFTIYNRLSLDADLRIKNIVMQRQIDYYSDLIRHVKEQDLSYRQERHNIKNQLITIRFFAINKQCSKIVQFTNHLLHENEFGLSSYSFCNHILLDALFCSKKDISEQSHIDYVLDLDVPSALPFRDIDLCILVGNALDNAFDAAISGAGQSAFVHVTIYYKNNILYCHFLNSFFHELSPNNGGLFYSTKYDSIQHGYGLYSIKKVVAKYNGSCEIKTEEHSFSLKIMLLCV